MKMRTYQLCRWCDMALRGRRKWAYLAGNALILLLSLLLGLLWLILPALLLANAVLALYLLHRHHAFGTAYQRMPRPEDALCETVLIDASLIGQGTRLRAVSQPIDVGAELSLQLGSGALLLGAAMTLTADELPPADRSAILSAVRTLNIKPSRLRSHNPVLAREKVGDVSIVTVRDGISQRQYYLGAPADVARRCAAIWEGSTRPLGKQDHLRIEDTARYIAQGNCRTLAWATALEGEDPIFLGMAGVGEELHLSALADVAALRAMGLTLMLDAGDQADTDLESLRSLLDLPDHHARADVHLTPRMTVLPSALGITRMPGDSLVEPITQLRERFRTMEDTLRRFALTLGMALLVALLSGSAWTPIFLTAMLVYAAIAIGVDLNAPKLRWPTLAVVCGLALLCQGFLNGQTPAVVAMSSGIAALTAALCGTIRLCGRGFTLKGKGSRLSQGMMGAVGLALLSLLVYGGIQGLSALLPLGFALLISAAIGLLILLKNKISK